MNIWGALQQSLYVLNIYMMFWSARKKESISSTSHIICFIATVVIEVSSIMKMWHFQSIFDEVVPADATMAEPPIGSCLDERSGFHTPSCKCQSKVGTKPTTTITVLHSNKPLQKRGSREPALRLCLLPHVWSVISTSLIVFYLSFNTDGCDADQGHAGLQRCCMQQDCD